MARRRSRVPRTENFIDGAGMDVKLYWPITNSLSMLSRSKPLHQQVEEDIRARILAGEFAAGSRLPSTSALAKRFGASIYTVQTALARLAAEGLLDRQPRLPTFVAQNVRQIKTVGIYLAEFLGSSELAFYQALCLELTKKLAAEGIDYVLWSDNRPTTEQNEIFSGMKRALDKRKVQAIIAPLVNSSVLKWLLDVPVPVMVLTDAVSVKNAVLIWNSKPMIRAVLERLRSHGCQTVGLISTIALNDDIPIDSSNRRFYQAFMETAERLGMKTSKKWIRHPDRYQIHSTQYGYEQFHALWKEAKRPDGLFAFPDTVSSGVVTAMLECQVRVPEDLTVALHVNEHVVYPCPYPAIQIVTEVGKVAEALIEGVRRQVNGEPAQQVTIRGLVREVDGSQAASQK